MNGSTNVPVTEADLLAYVDGKVPEARRAEVQVWLAARPDEAERIAAYSGQNEELRALFNPVLDEPVPGRLRHVLTRASRWRAYALAAGFMLLGLAVGTLAGWQLHAQRSPVVLDRVRIADTVGWGSPLGVQRVVGAIRNKWPDLKLALHLHDTRGTGMANALMGLQMGISSFDSSCAGLGGCPFAGNQAAAGNICTEDLVFMAEEMGIETGLDLDALIECARMAESIVGHQLPGKIMHGGSLSKFRS